MKAVTVEADHQAQAVRSRSDDPEVVLMLRAREDESGAFTELVERYWTRVFARFCRQLGDRQEAEDLTQDVFLRLYRSRKRYRPEAKFTTWLYHITQNVARNALRTRRRRPCTSLETLGGTGDDLTTSVLLPDRGEPPSRLLERAEMACVLRDAVSQLADRQRTALELHQFEYRTYSEVAAELNMTPKAAKSLLYRARNQLRENLGGLLVRERDER